MAMATIDPVFNFFLEPFAGFLELVGGNGKKVGGGEEGEEGEGEGEGMNAKH